jgi:hypothetical protein
VTEARQERRFARQVKKKSEPAIKSESHLSILTTKNCHHLNHFAFNGVVDTVPTANAPRQLKDLVRRGEVQIPGQRRDGCEPGGLQHRLPVPAGWELQDRTRAVHHREPAPLFGLQLIT